MMRIDVATKELGASPCSRRGATPGRKPARSGAVESRRATSVVRGRAHRLIETVRSLTTATTTTARFGNNRPYG